MRPREQPSRLSLVRSPCPGNAVSWVTHPVAVPGTTTGASGISGVHKTAVVFKDVNYCGTVAWYRSQEPFYIIDYKRGLAPQVGLEPTTLRLTARISQFLALLRIALYYTFSGVYSDCDLAVVCGDYPQFDTILNQSTHKSPHSELG
jgi:hypothetical protein